MLALVTSLATVFGIRVRFDCTAALMRQTAVAVFCAEEPAVFNVERSALEPLWCRDGG